MSLADGTYTITNRLYGVDLVTTDCEDHVSATSNTYVYQVASKGSDSSVASAKWTLTTSGGTQIISTSITPPGGTATTFKTHECTTHSRAEAYTDKRTGWTIALVKDTAFYTIANGTKRWKLISGTDGNVNLEVPPTDGSGQSAFQFTFAKAS